MKRYNYPINEFVLPGTTTIYNNYRYSAKLRGHPFELTRLELEKRIHSECYYCGSWNSNKLKISKKSTIQYNGIDRIDNQRGYTIDNSVTCCQYCNLAKGSRTHQEFKNWISQLIKFQTKS